ncbi:MAG: lipopolysaccharide biosynthesis protein [Rickettsiales bacterium]
MDALDWPPMQVNSFMPRRLRQSPFLSAVTILLSGATLAQLIPLLTMPFLARMYLPEMFAAQALLIMITTVCAPLSTGNYELAIPIPRLRRRADAIATMTLFLCLGFCAAMLLVIWLCWGWISTTSPLAPLHHWVLASPAVVLAVTLANICNYWLLREGRFVRQTMSKLFLAGSTAVLMILFGLLHVPSGLLIGFAVGQWAGALAALCFAYRAGLRFTVERMYALAILRHYRQFPIFGSVPTVISNMAVQLPLMLITARFSYADAGNYAVVRSLFNAGSMLIALAVGQVLMKHVAQRAQQRLPIWPYYRRLALALFAGACGLSAGAFVFGHWFFRLYLGAAWTQVGWIAQLLSINIVFMVTASALSFAALALKQVKTVALWQCSYGVLAAGLFFLRGDTFPQFVGTLVGLETFAYGTYAVLVSWVVWRHDRSRFGAV